MQACRILHTSGGDRSERTSAERVYARLHEDIVEHVLRPGEPLVEGRLAARYEVSRTPVREALRRLVSDGLAEPRRGGLVVRQLDRRQVEEVYPIIGALEGLAAGLAAGRLSPAQLRRIGRINREMVAMSKSDDGPAFRLLNKRFHAAIIEAAGNGRLRAEIARHRAVTTFVQATSLQIPARRERSCLEHEAVLEALAGRDAAGAEAAMRAHVASAGRLVVAMLTAASSLPPESRGG